MATEAAERGRPPGRDREDEGAGTRHPRRSSAPFPRRSAAALERGSIGREDNADGRRRLSFSAADEYALSPPAPTAPPPSAVALLAEENAALRERLARASSTLAGLRSNARKNALEMSRLRVTAEMLACENEAGRRYRSMYEVTRRELQELREETAEREEEEAEARAQQLLNTPSRAWTLPRRRRVALRGEDETKLRAGGTLGSAEVRASFKANEDCGQMLSSDVEIGIENEQGEEDTLQRRRSSESLSLTATLGQSIQSLFHSSQDEYDCNSRSRSDGGEDIVLGESERHVSQKNGKKGNDWSASNGFAGLNSSGGMRRPSFRTLLSKSQDSGDLELPVTPRSLNEATLRRRSFGSPLPNAWLSKLRAGGGSLTVPEGVFDGVQDSNENSLHGRRDSNLSSHDDGGGDHADGASGRGAVQKRRSNGNGNKGSRPNNSTRLGSRNGMRRSSLKSLLAESQNCPDLELPIFPECPVTPRPLHKAPFRRRSFGSPLPSAWLSRFRAREKDKTSPGKVFNSLQDSNENSTAFVTKVNGTLCCVGASPMLTKPGGRRGSWPSLIRIDGNIIGNTPKRRASLPTIIKPPASSPSLTKNARREGTGSSGGGGEEDESKCNFLSWEEARNGRNFAETDGDDYTDAGVITTTEANEAAARDDAWLFQVDTYPQLEDISGLLYHNGLGGDLAEKGHNTGQGVSDSFGTAADALTVSSSNCKLKRRNTEGDVEVFMQHIGQLMDDSNLIVGLDSD